MFKTSLRAPTIVIFKRLHCIAAASLAALAGLIASAQGASAGVRITVSYDFVETEVSPRQVEHRKHYVSTYQISGSKDVDFSSSVGTNGHGKLGHTTTILDSAGQPTRVAYRVAGGAIVIRGDKPSYTVVTRIITDGRTSCSATREYVRKPGHELFENVRISNHETMLESDMRAENLSCSIAESDSV